MKRQESKAPQQEAEEALSEARRKFLKQLARAPLYVAPLVLAVSINKVPAQFPSPPPPPP